MQSILNVSGYALSESNELVVSRWLRDKMAASLYLLERPTRAWEPLALPAEVANEHFTMVLGFDGRDPVTTKGHEHLRRMALAAAAQVQSFAESEQAREASESGAEENLK